MNRMFVAKAYLYIYYHGNLFISIIYCVFISIYQSVIYIYIYIYICVCVCVCARVCVRVYIYQPINTYIYIYANFIKHNRHFMSTYFLLDPFEFPYYFYCILGELIYVLSIVACIPSTFCPTLGIRTDPKENM